MDVDSPSIIPGTPNADDYASLGDGDDLSRRTTPAFPNEEIVTGKVEEEEQKSSRHGSSGREEPTIHINGTLHQHDALQQSSLAVPILEMDLDNNEDEQFEVQPLAAHRMERASSTSSSVNLKASTRGSGKRKYGVGNADSRGHSPASTPAPPEDSSSIATPPILVPGAVSGFFATRNQPMNKATFRYMPCGPSPKIREGIPLYRIIPSPPADTVRFSWEDRSSYTYISADASAITTDKGFRGARANIPIREGAYYFEIIVDKGAGDVSGQSKGDGLGPHIRFGIARREAPLNAPAGFDAYSYGIRDKTGDKVHISQPKPYGEAFGTGDVIGVYVNLPPRPTRMILTNDPDYHVDPPNPARIVRKRVPIRYKGQLYFESMEYAPSKEMEDLSLKTKDPAAFERARQAAEAALKQKSAPPPGKRRAPPPPVPPPARDLPRLTGSKLAFFKNGVCQGVAFEDLFDWLPLRQHAKDKPIARMSVAAQIVMARENNHDDGTLGYYPMASSFGGGIARLNAGPNFQYPPPDDIESVLMPANGSGTPTGLDARPVTAWKPLSERYHEYYEEQRILDEIDEDVAIAAMEAKKAAAAQAAAEAAANASVAAQAQAQTQSQQISPVPSPVQIASPVNITSGTLSNAPSPKGLHGESWPTKKKTGLSNELVPERDASGSPELVEPSQLVVDDISSYNVKLEEEDAEGSPELEPPTPRVVKEEGSA